MDIHFPNESAAYRSARNELLKAETELRKQIEAVAALRRCLPDGGRLKEDYVFEDAEGRKVKLSGLFNPGQDSLMIYNFMFGPAMASACPSCTSILDGMNGTSTHLNQRTGFVVVAKSPMQRISDYARERGWNNLRLLSSAGNSYNRDYYGESEDGSQMPMLNVFTKRNGDIHHFYGTELFYAPREAGQDPRHVDFMWPVWTLLDRTPEGRGTNWNPKLKY